MAHLQFWCSRKENINIKWAANRTIFPQKNFGKTSTDLWLDKKSSGRLSFRVVKYTVPEEDNDPVSRIINLVFQNNDPVCRFIIIPLRIINHRNLVHAVRIINPHNSSHASCLSKHKSSISEQWPGLPIHKPGTSERRPGLSSNKACVLNHISP